MKFAMCNEFCEGWPIEDAMRLAADTGYDGIEIAPFTLAESVLDLDSRHRAEIRSMAARHGLEIVGLHWLLVSPKGLYMNHPDETLRRKTFDYFRALIDCCADLGGDRMIIGSPKQRNILEGETVESTFERTADFFRHLAPFASTRGVNLLIEPLGRGETNFLTTKDEAIALVRAVDHPDFGLMLDCKAMSDEGRPLGDIIRETGDEIGHFHANDANLSYPGSGDTDFAEIMGALKEIGYKGWVSVEVFDFTPPPQIIATEALAHLRLHSR